MKTKKAPYAGTEIDPDDSRAQIDKMLRNDFGIDEIAWLTNWKTGDVRLIFSLEIASKELNLKRKISFMVQPPPLMRKARIYNEDRGVLELREVPNWRQSMRMLYWYLKNKLTAVAYGLVSVEKEFMSTLIIELPEGKTTLGEIMEARILDNRFGDLPKLEERV